MASHIRLLPTPIISARGSRPKKRSATAPANGTIMAAAISAECPQPCPRSPIQAAMGAAMKTPMASTCVSGVGPVRSIWASGTRTCALRA
jgi:hypothetical protein